MCTLYSAPSLWGLCVCPVVFCPKLKKSSFSPYLKILFWDRQYKNRFDFLAEIKIPSDKP